MDHDLFQIRRHEREAGGQRGVLFAEKRFELSFVAARADARGPQRGCTRRVAALQQEIPPVHAFLSVLAATRPCWMYVIVSAQASRSEVMCVEKRIDTPSCSQSVRNVSSSSSRETGSSPDVGSSRISSSALCDMAAAS